jgi:hypothetical protein
MRQDAERAAEGGRSARPPRLKATASVYSTPVPGETTTISEVRRNEIDIPQS